MGGERKKWWHLLSILMLSKKECKNESMEMFGWEDKEKNTQTICR